MTEEHKALEAYEMEHDVAAYDEAVAEDDGTRITLGQMRAELDELVDAE